MHPVLLNKKEVCFKQKRDHTSTWAAILFQETASRNFFFTKDMRSAIASSSSHKWNASGIRV